MTSDIEIHSVFPTPLMCIRGALPKELIQDCIDHILAREMSENSKCELLRHDDIQDPGKEGPYYEVGRIAKPLFSEFGYLMFGEKLDWFVKEIWTNVMEPGGHQAIHSHANSFISSVIYLTETHASSRTVFHRGLSDREFIFGNDNPNSEIGQFNGKKWYGPDAKPGDMILFPSYMLHEVPINKGQKRVTIALNAIPHRLDNWGYSVNFSSHRSSTSE